MERADASLASSNSGHRTKSRLPPGPRETAGHAPTGGAERASHDRVVPLGRPTPWHLLWWPEGSASAERISRTSSYGRAVNPSSRAASCRRSSNTTISPEGGSPAHTSAAASCNASADGTARSPWSRPARARTSSLGRISIHESCRVRRSTRAASSSSTLNRTDPLRRHQKSHYAFLGPRRTSALTPTRLMPASPAVSLALPPDLPDRDPATPGTAHGRAARSRRVCEGQL